MTDADRLRAALIQLDLSQRGAAHLLEVPERDIRHWAQGHGKVPNWLWLALEALMRRERDAP